jgi:hypothetical protein
MALSTRIKNRLMDAINMSFANIGNQKPTLPPRSEENTAPIAWDYFVSCHLLALAKKRRDVAHANAIRAGIIFDHMKHPRTPEDTGMIYTGDQVGVYLVVRNPGKRVNIDKMEAWLLKTGVPQETLDVARMHATEESKPAHEFKVSLITSDTVPHGK